MTKDRRITKPVKLAVLFAGACALGCAQALPPVILQIDTDNFVQYVEDTSDSSKFATSPNMTPGVVPRNFGSFAAIGDIVAVNGQAARGTVTYSARRLNLTTASAPGQAIADTTRQSIINEDFEIQSAEGIPIGTIICVGLGGPGPPFPGAPSSQAQANQTIVGGTGAYLGVRGETGGGTNPNAVPIRVASIVEDPAFRRTNGGGKTRQIFLVIPSSRPQIAVTANGPAITHSGDFSLVSPSKPAAAGEILSLFATGLGPTRPSVDPGQPFPSSPLAAVNSPVVVTVNGETAEVLGAVGYPGTLDSYQVNFRVPPDMVKGTATVQVSVAWVPGTPVNITVQ